MIRGMRNRIALVALVTLLGSAVAHADDRPFHFSLEWQVRYGQLDGYVQIPSGGQPGTTSSHRPTFGELGINNTGVYDFAASFDWGRDGFYVGAEFMRPSGDTTLDDTLVSHGVTFAAGTPVSSKVQLDWYRAGYQHHFDFANPDDPWSLTLTPM